MNKNIWIINQYSGSKHHKKEYRSPSIAKELVKLGYSVTIISSTHSHHFTHAPTITEKYTLDEIDNVKYLWIKTKKYSESKSIKRIFSMFEFVTKLFFIPLEKLDRPDYIFVSSPAPLPILNGIYFKRKFHAKLIFEVRDLWPLSIIELGDVSPKNIFVVFLKFIESLAYKKSDYVISVLSHAREYMMNAGMNKSKFHYVPNGIDKSLINTQAKAKEELLDKIPADKFIVGYAGALGIANDIYTFINVAEFLKDRKEIFFVLVGDGSEKSKLLKYTKGKNLDNVLFLGSVARNEVHSVLQTFDLCYLGLQNQPLFKYGVSPTKLFDYMAAAKPIVYVIDSGNHPVMDANCGYEAMPGDVESIANAIIRLYNLSQEERDIMGKNGYAYLQENYTYDSLAKKIIDIIK